jgi:spoIIIJ-associated protein
MSKEKTKLEVIAPTIEEAVEKGLKQLGLSEDDVDVEVLDEGKHGLFGLGNRQARVALTLKPVDADTSASEKVIESSDQEKEDGETSVSLDDEPEEVAIARETINIILEKMQVTAKVSVKLGDSDSNRVAPVLIDIEGEDLSFLIGKKAETINALQYITGLIVGRELGRWIPLQIDVQHYRQRRENELRKMARRIAEQVVSTGRRQVLEPMPPNERRIIHIELRENPNVVTESIGEDPRRKVTIRPKE